MARSFPASATFCSPCSQAAEPNSTPRVAGRGFGEGQPHAERSRHGAILPASATFCSRRSQAAEPNSTPRVTGRGFGEGQVEQLHFSVAPLQFSHQRHQLVIGLVDEFLRMFAIGDVANVALNDLMAVFPIDVADELYFASFSLCGSER
jgi:hypothetical protein